MRVEALKQILARAGIEVVGEGTNGWLTCRCPYAPWLHSSGGDRKPSFFVHASDDGSVSGGHCFTCGEKGRLAALIRKLGKLRGDFAEMQTLAMEADLDDIPDDYGEFREGGITSSRDSAPAPINASIYEGLYNDAYEAPVARRYLESRNVSKRATEALRLLYDPEEQRILFPVYDHQRTLYGFTGRTILPEGRYPYSRYPKVRSYAGLSKSHRLLGENLFLGDGPIIVVEGLFALARMIEFDLRRKADACAIMGAKMSEEQASRLIDYNRPIILLLDNDQAGEQGTKDAAKMLREHVPTMAGIYPDGVDDPDYLSRDELLAIIKTEHELL